MGGCINSIPCQWGLHPLTTSTAWDSLLFRGSNGEEHVKLYRSHHAFKKDESLFCGSLLPRSLKLGPIPSCWGSQRHTNAHVLESDMQQTKIPTQGSWCQAGFPDQIYISLSFWNYKWEATPRAGSTSVVQKGSIILTRPGLSDPCLLKSYLQLCFRGCQSYKNRNSSQLLQILSPISLRCSSLPLLLTVRWCSYEAVSIESTIWMI